MIVTVPAVNASKIPVTGSMEPTGETTVVDHAPPVPLTSVEKVPVHTGSGPVITGGCGFTVTACVEKQPVVGSVNVIVATPPRPAPRPVTVPVVLGPGVTVATPVALLVQVPDDGPVNIIVDPSHTTESPVGGVGFGLTDTTLVR